MVRTKNPAFECANIVKKLKYNQDPAKYISNSRIVASIKEQGLDKVPEKIKFSGNPPQKLAEEVNEYNRIKASNKFIDSLMRRYNKIGRGIEKTKVGLEDLDKTFKNWKDRHPDVSVKQLSQEEKQKLSDDYVKMTQEYDLYIQHKGPRPFWL